MTHAVWIRSSIIGIIIQNPNRNYKPSHDGEGADTDEQ